METIDPLLEVQATRCPVGHGVMERGMPYFCGLCDAHWVVQWLGDVEHGEPALTCHIRRRTENIPPQVITLTELWTATQLRSFRGGAAPYLTADLNRMKEKLDVHAPAAGQGGVGA